MHFKHLTLLLRAKGLAGAIARTAMRLHLLDHRPHADDLYLHTPAVALPALLHAFLLVDHLPGDRHLLGGAVVELLEGDLERLHYVLRLLALPLAAAAAPAAASEEGFENVGGVAAATAILEAFLTEFVVLGPLLGVAQHFVRACDLLELLGVAALVGVVLHCQLPVSLLDLGFARGLVNLETRVELGVVHVFAPSPTALASHAGEAVATAGETTEEHCACELAWRGTRIWVSRSRPEHLC
mmetsp:Transcript_42977/g.91628  ORF Transcript_42977/g.91628 Transcript_42977/m.91628 type:complete len:241 (-) Transcript_42977:16-738(-)